MEEKSDRIHVVMAADGPYVKGLEVAKASMVESCSDPGRLEFHLFEEDAVSPERMRREFGTYKGSSMAFLRLYLGELLPDVDWVVYSDVDTLWRRDVCELWNLRDESKLIQWVKSSPFEFVDWCREKGVPLDGFDPACYGCSGVCLMNLKRWRETDALERCRDFASRYGVPKYADQDIMNAVLPKECGLLPECWDVQIPSPENTPSCVLHITSVGRYFNTPYKGGIAQYRYWEHVARGGEIGKVFAPPFYLRGWMIRLLLPFASPLFRERVQRNLAWRWFVKGEMKLRERRTIKMQSMQYI